MGLLWLCGGDDDDDDDDDDDYDAVDDDDDDDDDDDGDDDDDDDDYDAVDDDDDDDDDDDGDDDDDDDKDDNEKNHQKTIITITKKPPSPSKIFFKTPKTTKNPKSFPQNPPPPTLRRRLMWASTSFLRSTNLNSTRENPTPPVTVSTIISPLVALRTGPT